MKLMSLNTWGCRVNNGIVFQFIKDHAESTHIFCLQEILRGGEGNTDRGEIKNCYSQIQKLLPNHKSSFLKYTSDSHYGENMAKRDFEFEIATFVNKNLGKSTEKVIVLDDLIKEWNDYSGRFAAGVALAVQVGEYSVINVHGFWQGSIKKDTEAKIEQSRKILEFAEGVSGQKIICGDFNLLPQTKSIQMIKEKYKDLIQEYAIDDTRGALYTKELRYSDYVFVGEEIQVKSFVVPKLALSDYLPMIMEF